MERQWKPGAIDKVSDSDAMQMIKNFAGGINDIADLLDNLKSKVGEFISVFAQGIVIDDLSFLPPALVTV